MSGVQYSDSIILCTTQCSHHNECTLDPLHLIHPCHHPPASDSYRFPIFRVWIFRLFCLSSTYEWTHTVCVFLRLFHLAGYPPGSPMLLLMVGFHSLWLSNIPLCIATASSLSIHLLMDTWLASILATVNNAAINIGVHVSSWISVLYSLGKYPIVELPGHMAILVLIFWGTSVLFSTVAAPACIPTNSGQEFLFLHTLTNVYYFFVIYIIYTMEYDSVIRKNGILPFVTIWMDLEGILLSEISQRKTQYDFTYM